MPNLDLLNFMAEIFILHLKEIEFRNNMKNLGQNIYQNLLKLIRETFVKFN